jgi:hypothetical protein
MADNRTRWQKFRCWTNAHKPGACGFDGATITSRCQFCHKRIGQDSQGNWFAFFRQDDD